MKTRIVFFGTPDFVIPVLKKLIDNFTVVGVVTAPDTIQGRKKLLTSSPVKQFALQHNIPVLQPEKLRPFREGSTPVVEIENWKLKIPQADLYVVAAYGKIIPQSILEIPKNGALNIHPSLLPKYRGTSPIQATLLNGDSMSGITIIKMDEKMDHGPILAQWEIPINPTDTFSSLHHSLFKDAAEGLSGVITDFLNNKITPTAQDEAEATFCEKITRESGYFDSENPPDPQTLDRMIRAYYPWPTTWTRVKLKNGEEKIMKLFPEGKIQMEGKNIVTMKEFLNGYPELKQLLERLWPASPILDATQGGPQ